MSDETFTHLRLPPLLLRVPVHVALELVLATEGAWTHLARVRPLARVGPHVSLQVGRASERRWTVVALQQGHVVSPQSQPVGLVLSE